MIKYYCWTVLNLYVVLLRRLSNRRRTESLHSVLILLLNHHVGKLKGLAIQI